MSQDERRNFLRVPMRLPAEQAMSGLAAELQSVVIPGVGHWVAEEASDEMLTALTAFLAPYGAGEEALVGAGENLDG